MEEAGREQLIIEIEKHFTISEVLNRQDDPSRLLVATSLFWKRPYVVHASMRPVTLSDLFLTKRFVYGKMQSPWSQYVAPLLAAAKLLKQDRPDVVFRVYLANDMRFLAADLISVGCEIYLMEESSIAHNPGAMWRFLALGEGRRGVTIIDSDRGLKVLSDIKRTEIVVQSRLGGWRVPYEFGVSYGRNGVEGYRPINASQFGVSTNYPIREMMIEFICQNLRGDVSNCIAVRDHQIVPIAGTRWPDYGFDEWFLQKGFYRQFALSGILTFVPNGQRPFSQFLLKDVEFATRSNRNSEVVYFG